jgi:hypothetical protein
MSPDQCRAARERLNWTRDEGPYDRLRTGTQMLAREQSAVANVDGGEGATVQFRVHFLDASGTIIQEMHADAWNAAAAIALVEGMEWPAGAVRMVILNAAGDEVHSESK